MNVDVRVLVLERGLRLTHDLSYACRHTGVSVLGPVRDVSQAEVAASEVLVDVLAIELWSPSIDVLRDATEVLRGVRVLAVTEALDPELGAAVVAAGAVGLMTRSTDQRTVPDILRRAAAGELILPAAHLAALVDLVRVPRLEAHGGTRINALTKREREVLALLAEGHSTQDVSAALSISVMTVQSHVKNVLAKLGVHSKVEAIRLAWRTGVLTTPVSA
jgi:DNA-binding NarL/FixJ family response regulator